MNEKEYTRKDAITYFILGVLLWIVVDWGTAGGFRFSYFQTYGVTLFLFYVFFPFIFTVLIFKAKLNDIALFIAMLIEIFIVEVIFTGNPLLMVFPVLLIGIPLAILIYLPLTYFPLWYIRGELGKHKRLTRLLIICELVVMFLTTFGNGG